MNPQARTTRVSATTPVLAQAGGSRPGLAFASSHAELMFLSAMSSKAIAQQVATVRGTARERGRRDEDILFLLGAMGMFR